MRDMTPFGVRQAVAVTPAVVDVAEVVYDPWRQVSVVVGVGVPVLKHSTGATKTNTATQDNAKGADADADRTED